MKHTVLYPCYISLVLLFWGSCGDNASHHSSSCETICKENSQELIKTYLYAIPLAFWDDSTSVELRHFLYQIQEELRKEKLPENFEQTVIHFIETKVLTRKIKVPCFDDDSFNLILNDLKNQNLKKHSCERINLVKTACQLLTENCLSTAYHPPVLKILQPDTLILKPNRSYSFPFRLEFDNDNSNVLLSDNLVSINGLKKNSIDIITGSFSNKILSDTFKIVLENKLTGEHWTHDYRLNIKLEK